MAVWNVVRAVVANVEAPTAERAETILYEALIDRGFDPMETSDIDMAAFEAEPGTEPDTFNR